jgi:hypothetical protein
MMNSTLVNPTKEIIQITPMLNSTRSTATETIAPPLPQLPPLDAPPVSIDPTNPLAWILVITFLLSNTDEVINAIANLIGAIADCKKRR